MRRAGPATSEAFPSGLGDEHSARSLARARGGDWPEQCGHARGKRHENQATKPGRAANHAPGTMNQIELELGHALATGNMPMACGEEPQERLEAFGAAALSDTELLALVLQRGIPPRHAVDLASRLMLEAGSLQGLLGLHGRDLERLAGMNRTKARQLVAVTEIARRMMRPERSAAPDLGSGERIARHFAGLAQGLEVEKFWVVCLNRKCRLRKVVELTSGTSTSTLVHPRDVYRVALREGAVSIVGVHNHPSGDPAPSAADIAVTRQLREAARMIDVDFLDHVVIGRVAEDPRGKGYFSFREANLL